MTDNTTPVMPEKTACEIWLGVSRGLEPSSSVDKGLTGNKMVVSFAVAVVLTSRSASEHLMPIRLMAASRAAALGPTAPEPTGDGAALWLDMTATAMVKVVIVW